MDATPIDERREQRDVRTGCPYCGVGCGLIASVVDGRVEAVRGDEEHPVNRGRTCVKPLALPEATRTPDRALAPLWREDREGRFTALGWEEMMQRLAERLQDIRRRHGPDSVAFYVSGQLLTEDYYAAAKLVKGFLGTNNLDSNSRLCMSSAVAGYTATFGADGPPPSYADIEAADCFLLVGSNAAACHPIVWGRILERREQGARLIVVDPRRTPTAAAADLHLQLRPGTDAVLLNAILAEIDRDGLLDRDYLESHVDGHEEMLAQAALWPPARAAAACGVAAGEIRAAAQMFAAAGAALALWSMGANQSAQGTAVNRGLLNLCLAAGHIGRPGAGPFSLTGQPNAMGGREVGGLAQLLPGYRSVNRPEDRAEMNRRWAIPPDAAGVSERPGLPATDLFDALESGRVKAVWIVATNPLVSMPDSERARAALARAELVVCQDAYDPTETSAVAHAVLPAAQWPEKTGTMTNSERRVTLLRQAIEPPGDALADWRIFARLAASLGWGEHFAWSSAAEVYDEFAALTAGRPCDQAGISHARLEQAGSLQWPCPSPEHPGTVRLYGDGRFPTQSGRAQVAAVVPEALPEPPDDEYPLLLSTGRIASQWHTMTRTGKSRRLMRAEREPFLELHPDDARASGLRDGDLARVRSRRGACVLRVRLDATLAPGSAFAPFHWGALHAPPGAGTVNNLTHRVTDPTSRQPALKAIAVRLELVAPDRRVTPAAATPRHLVVIGAGPGGLAAAESVIDHSRPGDWRITLVGREPGLPYNRVALSARLAGHTSESALCLHPPAWYAERGIEVLSGDEAVALDTHARTATLRSGAALHYDALILATGSTPLVPPIPGAELPGVHRFRTRQDARAILAAAAAAERVAVIGGGLLGLEAARALAERGLRVTVVHLVDRLMERQLDGPAAALLERSLRRLGIEILTGRATTEVLGEHRVEGLRFAWGEDLPADLVVMAAGVRPDVTLAQGAGLQVARGIVVDDAMRTSVAGVWALGECVEHRGQTLGLWAPVRAQARVAGAGVAGRPAAFHGASRSTRLKVAGVDLFCAGEPSAQDDGDEEVATLDTRAGTYAKLVLRDGRLRGAILLGDTAAGPRLGALIASGDPVTEAVVQAVTGSGDRAAVTGARSDDAEGDGFVCSCMSVSRTTIVDAIARDGLDDVDAVARVTRAGTGCGTCRTGVQSLLSDMRARA